MSAQKSPHALTQGKLNFGSKKPKRTTTQNVKARQTKIVGVSNVPKNNVESSDETTDVQDIEVSSSEGEFTSKSNGRKAVENRKSMRKLAKRTVVPPAVLRQEVNTKNQGAPELNENDPKYKTHYATIRKMMGYMPLIHSDGQGKIHEILRCFDMSYEFGPCVGIDRLERWERAHILGLNPPKEVKDILTTRQGLEQREFFESVLSNEV